MTSLFDSGDGTRETENAASEVKEKEFTDADFDAPLRDRLLSLAAVDIGQLEQCLEQLEQAPCDTMDKLFDLPEKKARLLGRALLNPDPVCLDWILNTHCRDLGMNDCSLYDEGVGLFNPVWIQRKLDSLLAAHTEPRDIFGGFVQGSFVPRLTVLQALDDDVHPAILRDNLLRLVDLLPARMAAETLVVPALWYGDEMLWQRMLACHVVPTVMPTLGPAMPDERGVLATLWLGRLLDNLKRLGGGMLEADEVFFDTVDLAAPELKSRMTEELLLSGQLRLAPDMQLNEQLENLLLLSGDVRAVDFLRHNPSLAAAISYTAHCHRPAAELHSILRLLSAAGGLPIQIGADIPAPFTEYSGGDSPHADKQNKAGEQSR